MSVHLSYAQIIEKQATVNIGTAGHVSHGKTTITRQLTDTRTQRYQSEKLSNKTIKLGYANSKIYKNPETGDLFATPSSTVSFFDPETDQKCVLVRHFSLVDCPGHEQYMSTMIGGTVLMDAAMIIIAANELVPQPQTYEHLLALSHSNISNYLVLQNKLDLITKKETHINLESIHKFLTGSPACDAPIIPISAEMGNGVNNVIQSIMNGFPAIRNDDLNKPVRMIIVRSFKSNSPGTKIADLVGSVIGGSIIQGVLRLGDYLELRPGVLRKNSAGKAIIQPLIAKVTSLKCEGNKLEYAVPGGLIGVGLSIDSGLSVSDKLVGFVAGEPGSFDDEVSLITNDIVCRYHAITSPDGKKIKLKKKNQQLTVVANGAMTVPATVSDNSKKIVTLSLKVPIAVEVDSKLALMFGGKLIGSAVVRTGTCNYDTEYPDGYTEISAIEKPTYELVMDICEDKEPDLDYDTMLEDIVFCDGKKSVQKGLIPPPDIKYVTKYTHIQNVADIVGNIEKFVTTSLNLGILILDFFKAEVSDTSRYNEAGHMVIDGRHKERHVESVLKKFLVKCFQCEGCKSFSMKVTKMDRMINRQCTSCSKISNVKKLF